MKIKKQTILFASFSGIVCIFLFVSLAIYFKNLSENLIPKSVELTIDNSKIYAKVNAEITPIIRAAIKNHQKRSDLLDDLASILSRYDIIDKYSVRLGFDGKLSIFAHVQTPVLAAHVKNDDIYIIGSGMKIIDKNPKNLSTQTIPNIFFPELQIKNKKEFQIDFAWFLDQINLIQNNIQWYDRAVQKIIWTDSIGFTVKLLDPSKNDPNLEKSSDLIVHLGHKELNTKIDRLKTIALVLKDKDIKPKEIDLDLIERAFIK